MDDVKISAVEAKAVADAHVLSCDAIVRRCYDLVRTTARSGRYSCKAGFLEGAAPIGEVLAAAEALEREGYTVTVGEMPDKRTIRLEWSAPGAVRHRSPQRNA